MRGLAAMGVTDELVASHAAIVRKVVARAPMAAMAAAARVGPMGAAMVATTVAIAANVASAVSAPTDRANAWRLKATAMHQS